MQTATKITFIEVIFTFADSDQHFQTFAFDRKPSEAEALAKLLSSIDRDQLRELEKISICQLTNGTPLPWIEEQIEDGRLGKYYFSTI